MLNFCGSALDLVVKDSQRNTLVEESVAHPPYIYVVEKPIAGKYLLEVYGRDVPIANYPFVLTISGEAAAAGQQELASPETSDDGERASASDNETSQNFIQKYQFVLLAAIEEKEKIGDYPSNRVMIVHLF